MNKQAYLVKLEKPEAFSSIERKLEECRKQLNALELKVSRLEKQVEEQNQELKKWKQSSL